MKRSKRYQELVSQIEKTRVYPLEEGISTIKELSREKFDESVELHLKMNLKGTKGQQSIRGSVFLPKPVGRTKTVAVLTEDEALVSQAREAGVDLIGGKDVIEEIKNNGGLNVDVIITDPGFMRNVAPVAKILGPKGLMPSPKNGTTTENVGRAVEEFKQGKAEYRMDKGGIIHQSVGKTSFTSEEVAKNIQEFITEIEKQKPEKIKGDFILKAHLALTHSPAIQVKV